MKARAFSYVRPATIAEAFEAFAAAGGEASYIAGGQSLVPALALRLQAPECLIDIAHIEALRGIAREGDRLRVGALTRHAEADLTGRPLDETAIRQAQAALTEDLEPADDEHVPAAMRLHLARVLLGRLLGAIAEVS